jgi:hypothetical protein
MNNISLDFKGPLICPEFKRPLSVRCANFLKFNPYARTTALVVANIGLLFLTARGLEFIEKKINASKSKLDTPFSFPISVCYFIASAVGLVSTLAIKSLFNLPLSNVAAGCISLGSIAVTALVVENS